MSAVAETFAPKTASTEEPRARLADVASSGASRYVTASVHEEQIRSLVHQLFFSAKETECRHVGFASAEADCDVAPICLSVVRGLREQGEYDVGLIDASLESSPLALRIGRADFRGGRSELESRLWLVPREEWLGYDPHPALSIASFRRLHAVSTQFDFSILCCGPANLLPTRIGRSCDGIVLVLSASKTRRLVAEKMREQFRAAGVPLLGTVLAGRQFPIPNALYERL